MYLLPPSVLRGDSSDTEQHVLFAQCHVRNLTRNPFRSLSDPCALRAGMHALWGTGSIGCVERGNLRMLNRSLEDVESRPQQTHPASRRGMTALNIIDRHSWVETAHPRDLLVPPRRGGVNRRQRIAHCLDGLEEIRADAPFDTDLGTIAQLAGITPKNLRRREQRPAQSQHIRMRAAPPAQIVDFRCDHGSLTHVKTLCYSERGLTAPIV